MIPIVKNTTSTCIRFLLTKTKIILTSLTTVIFFLGISYHGAAAIPAEYITNGNFETGTFSGWSVTNSGSGNWIINNGIIDPDGPTTPQVPILGRYDAMTNQFGPTLHTLSQQITIPSNIISADLKWMDRIFSHTNLQDPFQEAHVQIRDSTGTSVIAEIWSTNNGDPQIQPGPNTRSFDVASILKSFEGQTVTITIQANVQQFYFNYIIDNISLLIETNQSPDCNSAQPSKTILWPPNHRMNSINVIGVTDPDDDDISITIDSISQDEPTNGLGAGDTSPDGAGIGTDTAQIRAERSGMDDGRVYEISFTADDGNGGTCSGSVFVGVPHNSNSNPIDSGQNFDSTEAIDNARNFDSTKV
jgi:hypothetical protein